MRTMIAGLAGWMRFEEQRTESVRVVDTAITVVGTLVVAVSWVMLHTAR